LNLLFLWGLGALVILLCARRKDEDSHCDKELNSAEVDEDLDQELTSKIIFSAQQAGICNQEIERYIEKNEQEKQDNAETT